GAARSRVAGAAAETGAGHRLTGPSLRRGPDPAPQLLDLAAPGLAFEALPLRAPGRPGRPALPRNDGRARHELTQPLERLLAVAQEESAMGLYSASPRDRRLACRVRVR